MTNRVWEMYRPSKALLSAPDGDLEKRNIFYKEHDEGDDNLVIVIMQSALICHDMSPTSENLIALAVLMHYSRSSAVKDIFIMAELMQSSEEFKRNALDKEREEELQSLEQRKLVELQMQYLQQERQYKAMLQKQAMQELSKHHSKIASSRLKNSRGR